MTEMTSPTLQATALVDEWCKAYRRYLKDGSNSHAIHPVARDGLIAAVAALFVSVYHEGTIDSEMGCIETLSSPEPDKRDPRRRPLPVEGFDLSDNAGPMIAATTGAISIEEAHAETLRLREVAVPDPAPAAPRPRKKPKPAGPAITD